MRRLFLILVLFGSCVSQTNDQYEAEAVEKDFIKQKIEVQNESTEVAVVDTFLAVKKFKVARQDTFNIENWHYGARRKQLVKLTDQDILKYFQQSKLKSNPSDGIENVYFFSIQKNTNQRKSITLIEEYDFCCADLLLMTYNQNDELISKNKVAGMGGDGDWGYDEYGYFTTDTSYRLFKVEETSLRDDQDTVEYRIDSLVVQFKVDKDLSFEKTSEEKFQRNEITAN